MTSFLMPLMPTTLDQSALVVTPKGTRLARPSEIVFEILPNLNTGDFTKEDGEIVRDEIVRSKGPALE